MPLFSEITRQHLEKIRSFYDHASIRSNWAARGYRGLLAHYYNLLIPAEASVLEIGCGSGELPGRIRAARKTGVDLSATRIAAARERVPEGEFGIAAGEELDLTGPFDCIITSDTLNLAAEVQMLFSRLHACSHPGTRVIFNFQNCLWRPFLILSAGLA